VIGRDAVLDVTLALLEAHSLDAVTMRAVARKLRVDPMALYHYFPSREEMLAAAAARVYGALTVKLRGTWRQRLLALAHAYLAMLCRAGELMRYLAQAPEAAEAPSAHVRMLFFEAIESLDLAGRHRNAAHDAFIDLIHGISRSGTAPGVEDELEILFAGMSALARRRVKSAP
jgi:AcrR family transcriptional regulator